MKNSVSILLLLLLFGACNKADEGAVPVPEVPSYVQGVDGIDPAATRLTADDAAKVSQLFMLRESPEAATRAAGAQKSVAETFPIRDDAGRTVAYAVNYAEGGFGIVSATKKYAPILAFSDTGRLTPEALGQGGLGFWTECIASDIAAAESAVAEHTPEYAEVRSLWRTYERQEPATVAAAEVRDGYYWYQRLRSEMMGDVGFCRSDIGDYFYQLMLYTGEIGDQNSFKSWYDESNRVLAIRYAGKSVPPAFVWGEGLVGAGIPQEIKYMPLLETFWHQLEPFNQELPFKDSDPQYHKPAGCGAIAVAQIMNYHRHPAVVNGVAIDWEQTHLRGASQDYREIARLVAAVSRGVRTKWGDTASSTTIENCRDFFKKSNYTVAQHSSNIESLVIGEIRSGRPVYIRGNDGADGHAWVCDGYYSKDQTYKLLAYSMMYLENRDFPQSPYYCEVSATRQVNRGKYFHANWGWDDGYWQDSRDPAALTGEGRGWFYSVLNMENYKSNVQILRVIPN